jgi:CRP/FNR family transcriptional regulator, cyclic AMP receptor protein
LTASPAVDLFQSVAYWQGLPEPIVVALAQVARLQVHAAGATIFWEGEPAAGLFIVDDGCVKICRHSAEGREHILHLLYRGDTFNDVAVLDGDENPATAIAHTDARVWRIDRVDLVETAARHPDLAWGLLANLARRVRYLVTMVEGLSMRSVRGRLAHYLLEESAQTDSLCVPRLLTQEELANRLGTVREMVGRALRGLAEDGVIEFDRHSITILDAERLANEATA